MVVEHAPDHPGHTHQPPPSDRQRQHTMPWTKGHRGEIYCGSHNIYCGSHNNFKKSQRNINTLQTTNRGTT